MLNVMERIEASQRIIDDFRAIIKDDYKVEQVQKHIEEIRELFKALEMDVDVQMELAAQAKMEYSDECEGCTEVDMSFEEYCHTM